MDYVELESRGDSLDKVEPKIVQIYNENVIKAVILNFIMGEQYPEGLRGTTDAFTDGAIKEIQEKILEKVKAYVKEYKLMYGECRFREDAYSALQLFIVGLEHRHAGVVQEKYQDALSGFCSIQEKVAKQLSNRICGSFHFSNSSLEHYIQKKRDALGFVVPAAWNFHIEACGTIHEVELVFEKISITKEGPAMYKLNCICLNCGAKDIRVVIPKGIRAEKYLAEAFCPKCMCQGVANL
jgi:hypothetical protein